MRNYHKAAVWRLFSRPGAIFSVLLAALVTTPTGAQVNVLTANYGNARTNATLNETVLNTLNVNATQFGKLFSLPVGGYINAQPLYVQNVAIPGKGTHNVVYVATLHNDVYAFDADTQASPLWHVNLGPSVPAQGLDVADLSEIGILSTPVIDDTTGTIYVVANTEENSDSVYRLHALDIATGEEKFGGPTVIAGSAPSQNAGSQNGLYSFKASNHLQRPGLLLLNNVVYIAFGSHNDTGDFHGWLMGYNAGNVQQQTSVFLTSAHGWGASIWQGGRGPVADEQGNIYVVTGNGSYDGTVDWGMSVMKLDTSSGTPTVTDWFTPDNWEALDDLDSDFGSCGPVLTSSGTVIAGGKEGILHVLDRQNMGHSQAGNGQVLQRFQAIGFGIFNMAYWERPGSPIVYLRAYNDAVKAFRMTGSQFETKPFSQSSFTAGLPFDGMAVSVDGAAQFSAILWVTTTSNGDTSGPGVLHALRATDLSKEIWNSDMNASRDGLGNLAKFTAPTIANGKVYVPTFSNRLVVYGLITQKKLIGDVVNSASGLSGPVAPGELVVVYGSGLGPSALAGAQVDSAGHVSTNVAGTQVLFNNLAAPLIYTRADQVAAIVPNAVEGQKTVTVQVKYNGQSSPTFSTSVADTVPGIFTVDQTGQGQGAMLNQDTSPNTAANPATRGSIVVLWATGQGQSDPDWAEDVLASDPLPQPKNKVNVNIGGQWAQILYAGAAPGLAGVIQVNAKVPYGIKPGSKVPVVLRIGEGLSQPGVTMAVQ
ncbi:MAG: hypothetical protein LAP39_21440 [Acidobacteriia bacterium]|nr:hypothetical protein [Terriglobia bacterium]